MRVQIITSSYPKDNNDPTGTAGLFVRDFADTLTKKGHIVIVHPIARKSIYSEINKKIIVSPIPWSGGDIELASMPLNLKTLVATIKLLINGRRHVLAAHKKYKIDYVIAMWVVPSGIFSFFINKKNATPYDVWALGSDVWRIKKIPFIGNWLLKLIAQNANHIMADGIILANDFKKISNKECTFLPTSRKIPLTIKKNNFSLGTKKINLLFVGRYHTNKGPDILINAINLLPKSIQKKINVNFYGLGPLEEVMKNMVNDYYLNSTIHINGPIDLNSLLRAFSTSDYLVISSRIESIPIIFSDALQSGTAVISTPAGDLRKLISKYKCGLCANSISPESLAVSIEKACQAKPSSFNPGIKKVQNLFNISQIVDKWIKLSK